MSAVPLHMCQKMSQSTPQHSTLQHTHCSLFKFEGRSLCLETGTSLVFMLGTLIRSLQQSQHGLGHVIHLTSCALPESPILALSPSRFTIHIWILSCRSLLLCILERQARKFGCFPVGCNTTIFRVLAPFILHNSYSKFNSHRYASDMVSGCATIGILHHWTGPAHLMSRVCTT